MAEECLLDSDEENILYDLLVITEWPPETDTQVSEISTTNIIFNQQIPCVDVQSAKMATYNQLQLVQGHPRKAT